MPQLLDNKTTNGDGITIDWNGNGVPGTLQISGTFDGAKVTILGSIDNGVTFITPANGVFGLEIITDFEMAVGKIKATISNAGPSTNLNAHVSPG